MYRDFIPKHLFHTKRPLLPIFMEIPYFDSSGELLGENDLSLDHSHCINWWNGGLSETKQPHKTPHEKMAKVQNTRKMVAQH